MLRLSQDYDGRFRPASIRPVRKGFSAVRERDISPCHPAVAPPCVRLKRR